MLPCMSIAAANEYTTWEPVEVKSEEVARWWVLSLIPALGRQRQADLNKFEAWSTEQIPGQPGLLYRETLSQKAKQRERERERERERNLSAHAQAELVSFNTQESTATP